MPNKLMEEVNEVVAAEKQNQEDIEAELLKATKFDLILWNNYIDLKYVICV